MYGRGVEHLKAHGSPPGFKGNRDASMMCRARLDRQKEKRNNSETSGVQIPCKGETSRLCCRAPALRWAAPH